MWGRNMNMVVTDVTHPLRLPQFHIIIGHVLEAFAFVDHNKPILPIQRPLNGITVIEVRNSTIKIRLIVMIIYLNSMYLTGVKQVNLQKLSLVFALGYPESSNIFIIGIFRSIFLKARRSLNRFLVRKEHPSCELTCFISFHSPIAGIIPVIGIRVHQPILIKIGEKHY